MSKRRIAINLDDLEWSYNTGHNPMDQGRAKTLISKELNGAEDLRLGVGWLEPGEVHILHHHPSVSEFYYIQEGSGKVMVGGEEIDAVPGTGIYIPAGESHNIVNDGEVMMVVIFGYPRGDFDTVWDG